MKNPNIKPSNYDKIKRFVINGATELQGTKLKALFHLIEKKGEPIETAEAKLQGVKALRISEGEWIAIKRIGIAGSFYPCCLKTYLLQSI